MFMVFTLAKWVEICYAENVLGNHKVFYENMSVGADLALPNIQALSS